MKFIEITSLRNCGPIDQEPDSETDGSLLVGEERVGTYLDRVSSCGHDFVEVFPAYHRGEKAWLLTATWEAAQGYSASGIQDTVVSFEEGCRLLLTHGAFTHLWGDNRISMGKSINLYDPKFRKQHQY